MQLSDEGVGIATFSVRSDTFWQCDPIRYSLVFQKKSLHHGVCHVFVTATVRNRFGSVR